MSVKYMIGIKNIKGELVSTVFASTIKYGIKKYRKENCDYNCPVVAEFITTPEGYNITTLNQLKKGDYFMTINNNYSKVGKTVYVKDDYDHSYEKYYCYKFYDACSGRMFHGETLVTDCMTF